MIYHILTFIDGIIMIYIYIHTTLVKGIVIRFKTVKGHNCTYTVGASPELPPLVCKFNCRLDGRYIYT